MSSSSPVGLFGGTFNPVHKGHIEPVLHVRDELRLGVVHFVPVSIPSHRAAPGVSAANRLAMVTAALESIGDDSLVADSREIDRDGASYTIDTLIELREQYGPARPLVLILGLDAFAALPTWYRWDELLDYAHIAVMERPGSVRPNPLPVWWSQSLEADLSVVGQSPSGAIVHVDTPLLDISSTAVRRSLAEGDVPSRWLDSRVEAFIREHGLYGLEASANTQPQPKTQKASVAAGPDTPAPPAPVASGASENSDVRSAESVRDVVVEAMDDAKAVEITALDVRGMTDVTDFMIIATGTSDRHLRAVATSVREGLRDARMGLVGSEGDDGGDWVLIDCGPVVAHVMRRETRDFYDLDSLWSQEVRDLMQAERDGDMGDTDLL